MSKRIGLVLAATPAYSETFFRNKIVGLQQKGIEVILFVNHIEKSWEQLCPVVIMPSFNKPVPFFKNVIRTLYLLSTRYKRAFKLFTLNKKEGLSVKASLKNTILNAVFLNFKLDWLHFGFGTLALGREQVAESIEADMAVSFRGFDLYIYPVKYPECYDLLFKKEVTYHVLSDEMKATLMDKGIKKETIFKITPAIQTDLFNGTAKKLNEGMLELVTVARLHWIKGLEYTLESLSILKKRGYEFKYTIIGEGIEKERLVFAAHQLGIGKQVVFLGKKNQTEIIEILKKSDIYLQYSLQEGFSNATLEAQAMGLICVVSDADGLSENVLDTITGFVVKKRNPEELASKIQYILSLQEEEISQIKKNAIKRVQNEFNTEKQIDEFLNFYKYKS